jgi:hypothetical protein
VGSYNGAGYLNQCSGAGKDFVADEVRFAGFTACCPCDDADGLFLDRKDSFRLGGGAPEEEAVGQV